MTGADIDFIYGFARDYGYQINLITANSQEEEIEFLKNKSADLAVGYFPIREDKKDEISFSNFWHKGGIVYCISLDISNSKFSCSTLDKIFSLAFFLNYYYFFFEILINIKYIIF